MTAAALPTASPVADGSSHRLVVPSRGRALLAQPLLNKGTAFTARERDAFGLLGLLPPGVATLDEQVARELEHVRRKADDLERHIGLAALHDPNETLFYRLLVDNLEEFLPIVYTPTVGLACQHFSHIFRRPRGIWITPDDVGRIDHLLRAAGDAIRLIVVPTTNASWVSATRGPVGCRSLWGSWPSTPRPLASIRCRRCPSRWTSERITGPLLDDPLYLGHRAPRLRGPAYDAVVEAFVDAVARVFPTAVVQWEDFKQHNAVRILERYRRRLPSFNDDMQGTAAVVLAGLLAARRERGGLTSDKFMFVGAGAAAIGTASLLRHELVAEGMDPRAAASAIVMLDSRGLVHTARPALPDDQRPFALDPARLLEAGLQPSELVDPVAIARATGATVLIGASACAGAFTEALVREVGLHDPVPIMLPLSNPSACAEARPEDILTWTAGRALVATGGPSRDVAGPAGTRVIGQANNVFIFPGMGLGAIVAETREVTDDMFLVAAHELAGLVLADRLRMGALYPPIAGLRAVARAIAVAVVREARESGHGRAYPDEEIELAVDRAMWWPEYVPFEPGD